MESGSVGGYIIKKIIEAQERQMTYVFDGLKRPSALRDSVLDTIGACHQWYQLPLGFLASNPNPLV